jgi:hypothetical protein
MVACKEEDTFLKIMELYRDGDKEAAFVVVRKNVLAGQCITLHEGSKVQAVNGGFVSGLHGTLCFRPQGDPDCYWTYTRLVSPIAE